MTTGDAGTSSNARLSAAGMLKQLRKHRLLSEAEIERIEREVLPQAGGSVDLARRLIRAKLLTKFQCNHILGGKAAKLRLGSYVVQDRIGAGGMGEVYRAWHPRLNRLAAIKILPARLVSDADAVQRFHREARAAAQLSHPNVVMTHDADESGGVHYLVMEYVEGTDLAAVVRRNGPLSVAQAVSCIAQTARGLEYAHGQGVIHRDVKPHNLLLDTDGTIRILDLGLARVDEDGEQEQLTATGSVMGTVDFMPPEQAEDSRQADARADIYSLGCTLYYLLSGRPMYAATTAVQKILAHREQPVLSLTAAREDVPAALDTVYRRMVAKVPAERYQSMTEVLSALEETQLLESEPTLPAGAPPTRALVPGHSGTTETIDHRPRSAETVNSSQDLQETVITGASAGRKARPVPGNKTLVAAFTIAVVIGLVLLNGGKEAPDPDAPSASGNRTSPAATGTRAAPTAATGWHGWPADAPAAAIAPFNAIQAKQHQEEWAKYLGLPVEYENSIGMKFRLIPPGEFLMGSTPEEIEAALQVVGEDEVWRDRIKSEAPQHEVVLTQPIYIGITEVTQAQYEWILGTNPSHFSSSGEGKDAVVNLDTGSHPVETVSWYDATEFCAKLSQLEMLKPFYFRSGGAVTPLEGNGYRLPTAAEWEFACRAGTTTRFWNGDETGGLLAVAWFNNNASGRTHAVGQLKANPFGLSDVHGNVREWVQDGWHAEFYRKFEESTAINPSSPYAAGSLRSLRGGFWLSDPFSCRSSDRYPKEPWGRNYAVGFRAVLTVDAVRQQLAGEDRPRWNPTPEQQAFIDRVKALPAEEQVDAVRQKLIEINPGFGGKFMHRAEYGRVVHLDFGTSPDLKAIWPVRAFPRLRLLEIEGTSEERGKLRDLSGLAGLPLSHLYLPYTAVSDLSPLKGMPLTLLELAYTSAADLSPLKNMPLKRLNLRGTSVANLSPLKNMPLKQLDLSHTPVTDLSPLSGMPLQELHANYTSVVSRSPLK